MTTTGYRFVLRDFQNFPKKVHSNTEGRSVISSTVLYAYPINDLLVVLKEEQMEIDPLDDFVDSPKNGEHRKFISVSSKGKKDRKKSPFMHMKQMGDELRNVRKGFKGPSLEFLNGEKFEKKACTVYRLQLVTSSGTVLNTVDPEAPVASTYRMLPYEKNQLSLDILNEYIIDEEIIGIFYKKRNSCFHDFYERSQNDAMVKDWYVHSLLETKKEPLHSKEAFMEDSWCTGPCGSMMTDHPTNDTHTGGDGWLKSSGVSRIFTDSSYKGIKSKKKREETFYDFPCTNKQVEFPEGKNVHWMDERSSSPKYEKNSSVAHMNNTNNTTTSFEYSPMEQSPQRSKWTIGGSGSGNRFDRIDRFLRNNDEDFSGRSMSEKNKIECIPPVFMHDHTLSEYNYCFDIVVITKQHIYCISKNNKVQRVEKMVNLFVDTKFSYADRNICSVVLEEQVMRNKAKNNLELLYKYITQPHHNKNELAEERIEMIPSDYKEGEKSPINKSNNSSSNIRGRRVKEESTKKEPIQYDLIYKYYIKKIMEICNDEAFICTMWTLLFNHVYRFEIMSFSAFDIQDDSIEKSTKETKLSKKFIDGKQKSEKKKSHITRPSTEAVVFTFSMFPEGEDNKSVNESQPEEFMEPLHSIDLQKNKNHVDYELLSKIYKPSVFKHGFIDRDAAYIFKQEKLQKENELEIRTRKAKGLNHLFGDHADFFNDEMERKKQSGMKYGQGYEENNDDEEEKGETGVEDFIRQRINEMEGNDIEENELTRQRHFHGLTPSNDELWFRKGILKKEFGDPYSRRDRETINKMRETDKNKSGLFAYEFLTNKSYDITFFKNMHFYNNSVHLLSKGLMLFVSRLLKPVLFIELFSSTVIQEHNIFKFGNALLSRRKTTNLSLYKKGKDDKEERKDTISLRHSNVYKEEEFFYYMKNYLIIRMNNDGSVENMERKKKRPRDVFERNCEYTVLKGNVPLDYCLNLIEKLKCLNICIRIILSNMIKKKKYYSGKVNEINDLSIKNIYFDFSVMLAKEISEFSSILNFVHFSIEYLLVYSIIISDYYKSKGIVKRGEVDCLKNAVYIPSTVFDLLVKCNFMKAYLSKTYRDILKQCVFNVIKIEKYIPIDFFQGYIIHKNEFLALHLTKQIEEKIVLKKKLKMNNDYEYFMNDKYDEFLISEQKAENFIDENLKDTVSSVNVYRLVILLYKVGFYKCTSKLLHEYTSSFYRVMNFKDRSDQDFIERKQGERNYYEHFTLKDNNFNYNIIENMDMIYSEEYFTLYYKCFLPIEQIVHVNYMNYLYRRNEKKKNKVKTYLSTLLQYFQDINFHFFVFNLITYKCDNKFPCSVYEFHSSPFLYYFIKLNEMNMKDAYVYYFNEKKYQDMVIFFSRRAFGLWNMKDKDDKLRDLLDERGNVQRTIFKKEKINKHKEYNYKEKEKDHAYDNTIVDNVTAPPIEHIKEYFLDFITSRMNHLKKEKNKTQGSQTGMYIEEDCFSLKNMQVSNPLLNEETKHIFYCIYWFLTSIRSVPTITKRMEYLDRCLTMKIYIIKLDYNCKATNRKKNSKRTGLLGSPQGVVVVGKDVYGEKNNATVSSSGMRIHDNHGNQSGENTQKDGSSVEELLNRHMEYTSEQMLDYIKSDKNIEYDESFDKSIQSLMKENKCLFTLKQNMIPHQRSFYLRLDEIQQNRESLLFHRRLLEEMINLFVYYIYRFCQWDILKYYFWDLLIGTIEEKHKILLLFENMNREENKKVKSSFMNMYDHISTKMVKTIPSNKKEQKGKDKTNAVKNNKGMDNREEGSWEKTAFEEDSFCNINIKLIIQVIDTFKEFFIILQKRINTKENLKNILMHKGSDICNVILPSFNLLQLIIKCDEQKDRIEALNTNCTSTVNEMVYNERHFTLNYFSKYSSYFERLLDYAFASSLHFKKITFVVNYTGDMLKLYNKKFKNCLYILVAIKLHKFINILLKTDKIKRNIQKKKGIPDVGVKSVNLKQFLLYIPHIYLDRQLNAVTINESYEFELNPNLEDQVVFSKVCPFSKTEDMKYPTMNHRVYSYYDRKENFVTSGFTYGEEDEGNEVQNKNISEEEEENINEVEEVVDQDVLLKNLFKKMIITPEDARCLNYLYKVNSTTTYSREKNDVGFNGKNDLIILTHKNFCFHIVWVVNLLLNYNVKFKNLIEVYVKIYNSVKYQKFAELQKHEIVIIIYYLFSLWINGTKNHNSFFFFLDEVNYNDMNIIDYFMKGNHGTPQYTGSYSLLILMQEMLSRAEFYFKYTVDAHIREYDISTIVLDAKVYNEKDMKKGSVELLLGFFEEISRTYEEVMLNIPVLNKIKQFQNMQNFLNHFKIFLGDIYLKISTNKDKLPWE